MPIIGNLSKVGSEKIVPVGGSGGPGPLNRTGLADHYRFGMIICILDKIIPGPNLCCCKEINTPPIDIRIPRIPIGITKQLWVNRVPNPGHIICALRYKNIMYVPVNIDELRSRHPIGMSAGIPRPELKTRPYIYRSAPIFNLSCYFNNPSIPIAVKNFRGSDDHTGSVNRIPQH